MARTNTGSDVLTAEEELMIQNLQGGTYSNVTPGGTANGSNTAFTLPVAPSPSSSLALYKNGQLLKLTTDYTLSGLNITFIDAPLVTDILRADFLVDS